jgi:ABC-type branched-subunit amino acid transport system ATPase component/sugar phosphate permease
LFVILFMLSVVDEFDRTAMAVLAPDIQESLGMSDAVLGVIGGAAGAMFVLGAVPIGAVADRVRRTGVVAVATAVWAGIVFATGFVRNSFGMFVARMGTGLGQSNVLPVHNALLADAFPIEIRGRLFALNGLASPIGHAIAPVSVGAIAAIAGGADGWRWVFWLVPIPAMVLAVAAWLQADPPRGANEQRAVLGETLEEDEAPIPVSMGNAFARLNKIKTFRYMLLGIGALGFALFSIPLFFNLFLEDHYGLDAFERGIVGSITVLPALVTIPFAGRLMDRRFRRSPETALVLVAMLVALFGVITVVALYMPSLVLLVVVFGIGAAFSRAGFVSISPIVAAVVPYRLRSQGFAMIGVYIFLLGAFSGAVITGIISDAWGERVALSLVAAPASIVGGALIALGARHIRRDISLVVEELIEERDEMERLARSEAEAPVLQVRNLDFSYGTVQVLFDVAFDVEKGEVLALLGTNGAGKSTVLRAISGLGIPDRGVIRLNGRTITYTEAEARVRLGVVQMPGGDAIWEPLTVAENLRLGAFLKRRSPETVDRRIASTLETFPALRERLDEPAGSLSGGQQQMLALAKALILEPEVLLIDELSLGLAPVVVQELIEIVATLREQGITMVIVEQSVNVALAIADRAVFMEKGEVRFDGAAADLLERGDLLRAVFLGSEGG